MYCVPFCVWVLLLCTIILYSLYIRYALGYAGSVWRRIDGNHYYNIVLYRTAACVFSALESIETQRECTICCIRIAFFAIIRTQHARACASRIMRASTSRISVVSVFKSLADSPHARKRYTHYTRKTQRRIERHKQTHAFSKRTRRASLQNGRERR